jgi:hypothetical protein
MVHRLDSSRCDKLLVVQGLGVRGAWEYQRGQGVEVEVQLERECFCSYELDVYS